MTPRDGSEDAAQTEGQSVSAAIILDKGAP